MERLGDFLGNSYAAWLASSISCCLPRSQERPHEEDQKPVAKESRVEIPKQTTTIPVSKYNLRIIHQQPSPQPRMSWPNVKAGVNRSTSRSNTQDEPQFAVERRSLASRTSRRLRSGSRPPVLRSRRPTIGAPTDFRRSDASEQHSIPVEFLAARAMSPPLRKASPFRPLQLSIYIPGNELPMLPRFSDDDEEDDELPTISGISRPPSAVMRASRDINLLRSNTSFSVPRKPVPSRTHSAEPPRYSIESSLSLPDILRPSRSYSLDHAPVELQRPSIATTKSAQEFLDAINTPHPSLPQSAAPRAQQPQLQQNPTDGGCSIYRRASEQSLRLRTHLEERQALERECGTITEERSPVSPLSTLQEVSPIVQTNIGHSNDSTTLLLIKPELTISSSAGPVSPLLPALPPSPAPLHSRSVSQAHSSSSSSTLLDEKLASLASSPSMSPRVSESTACPAPIVATTPAEAKAAYSNLTLSQRLSSWLNRSLTTHHSHLQSRRPLPPSDASVSGYQHRRNNSSLSSNGTTIRKIYDVHSAPNERVTGQQFDTIVSHDDANLSETTMIRKRERAATQSSVSTYVTTRGLGVDLEKFPIPEVREVGVAI